MCNYLCRCSNTVQIKNSQNTVSGSDNNGLSVDHAASGNILKVDTAQ